MEGDKVEKWIQNTDFSQVFADVLSIANDLIGDQTFYISFIDGKRMKLMKTLVKSDIFIENGLEMHIQETYCQMAYENKAPVLVEEAKKDERTKNKPATFSMDIGSYAGVPIKLNDGRVFGTLCAINTSLHEYDSKVLHTLTKLASFLAYAIDRERLLVRDHLTGLYNRAFWQQAMRSDWIQKGTHAFLMMDMDKFKKINDSFGHEAGDEVLVQAASVIESVLPEEAYAFRFSGDEFGVLFVDRDVQEALVYARQMIEDSKKKISRSVPGFCLSAGLTDTSLSSLEQLMAEADRLLYESKRAGGCCVSIQKA